SLEAMWDARRVCQKLNIPFYTLNFASLFKERVVDYFLAEYQRGRTPNPCVICNLRVKLGELVKRLAPLGFEKVVSGHYAILRPQKKNEIHLYRARDKQKDQSYFLYRLTPKELAYLWFPLGEYTKVEVRKIAQKLKLPTANKRESHEVCFIPEKKQDWFLRRHLRAVAGPIKTLDGRVVGKHHGLFLYTIGQRRGLDLPGQKPYYVAKLDTVHNTLYVVDNKNHPALLKDKFKVVELNWICNPPTLPLGCQVVIRYGSQPVQAQIIKQKKDIWVIPKFPLWAVTPGQSAVFYRGDEIIGGGIIDF
ncbi:tRNA 2-thiouridine(34) synthase MnmA, partial [Candidatus Parcubacteria bacterium]